MPQASNEDRALWGGANGVGEDKAIGYLQARGWALTPQWQWAPPTLGYVPDNNEVGAICFLIDEWDYGGVTRGGWHNRPGRAREQRPLADWRG